MGWQRQAGMHADTRKSMLQKSTRACKRDTPPVATPSMAALALHEMLALVRLRVFACAGSPWRVWSSARPRRDGDVRYQFVVYTREAPAGPAAGAAATAGARGQQLDVVGAPPVLPPAVAGKHDEHQVGGGCARKLKGGVCVHVLATRLTSFLMAQWGYRLAWSGAVASLLPT